MTHESAQQPGYGTTVGVQITAATLQDIGLFGGISEECLTLLAAELPQLHARPGQTIVVEGDLSSEIFVVVAGELEVVKRLRGHARAIRPKH